MTVEVGHRVRHGLVVKGQRLLGTFHEPGERHLVDIYRRLLQTGVASHVGGVEEAPMVWSCLVARILFFVDRKMKKGGGGRWMN